MSYSSILKNPSQTKSTAFTVDERERLGLKGLLPYAVTTIESQQKRVLSNFRRKQSDLERYIFLTALQNRNETLFYRTLIDNIEEFMPYIYTPTVGEACTEFAHIFRGTRGFYITPDDRGQIRKILDNWPEKNVRVIVATDGERVLGLGDLGANGMGISIGKLSLYTACAGIHPDQCLPVMLDVGTNNERLRDDPFYLGYPSARITGQAYVDLIDEFMWAVRDKYPDALVQFEDFLTPNAYGLLDRFRDDYLCFNDDIQGTAAVTMAGILASSRLTGKAFKDLKIMFLGAGAAATGIADLLEKKFVSEGLSPTTARQHLWFVDINGLVVKNRTDLAPHNIAYAHDHPECAFDEALDVIQPDVLIGATGAPNTFTESVIRKMAALNHQPVIFALSNPTSRAECTAEQAYKWSDGRAIFSSGSPFAPVTLNDGSVRKPGQCNNAYVFPGIGLGALASKAQSLPDELFMTAAETLANLVPDDQLKAGNLFPKFADIRTVSRSIGVAVAERSSSTDEMMAEAPKNIQAHVDDLIYDPSY